MSAVERARLHNSRHPKHTASATLLAVKHAQTILGLAFVRSKICQCLLALSNDSLLDSSAPWSNADLEQVRSHVETVSALLLVCFRGKSQTDLRVIKDIYRNCIAAIVECWLHFEAPY